MAKARIVLNTEGQFSSIGILCPGCRYHNGTPIEHHMPVKPIPPGLVDSPYNATKPHWDWNGDLEKPTFSPSLLNYIESPGGRRCHSFIKEGRIQFLGDCTHALKGQTVDLLDFPEDEADG